ncbi:MAG: hypothetical protein P1U36_00190 [Legionellaceae bacterium]|nr:hypothetical protein [Legionellaceae bacterium]
MPIDYSKPNPLRNPSVKMSDLSIEVVHQEHVEIEQHVEIEVDVSQDVQTTQTITQQVEVTATYVGDRVDYAAFNTDHYQQMTRNTFCGIDEAESEINQLYKLIEKENFANIPRAIKYFSPAAAEHVARHLATYVSIDLDNLPQGFSCALTHTGEIVLEYDEYAAEEEEQNAPPFSLHVLEQTLMPEGNSLEMERREYVGFFWAAKQDDYPDFSLGMCRLVDNKQYECFKTNLQSTNQRFFRDPRFQFIYQHYLRHLSDCEPITDGAFYKRIHRYEDQKYTCLTRFLTNTGTSGHDINKTLDDFEFFWERLEILCRERGVDIAKFEANWQVPEGGHPAVYMQRLLYILTASRDLEEQFIALKDVGLGQNGAYYAMRNEAFHVVSAGMNLSYSAIRQNKIPFSATRDVYRVSWSDLFNTINRPNELVKGHAFADLYRMIAEQDHSIDVNQLQKCFDGYCKKSGVLDGLEYSKLPAYTFLLFSVAHQGYLDEKQVSGCSDEELISGGFIRDAENAMNDRGTNSVVLKHLLDLFNDDIKFNTKALSAVTSLLSGVNSQEIERFGGSEFKLQLLERLFVALRQDKYSALRFLYLIKELGGNYKKIPIDYYLDMADFLAHDEGRIAALYQQDLLVLSAMLLGEETQYSCRKQKDTIPKPLQQIKTILSQAASDEPQAEFMRYAIRHIILAGQHVESGSFLNALDEIKQLPEDSPLSAVNNVLNKHKLYQEASHAIVVSLDTEDLRHALLTIIFRLRQEGVLYAYLRDNFHDLPENPTDDDYHTIINDPNQLSIDDLGGVITTILENANPQERMLYQLFLTKSYNEYRDTQIVQYFTQHSTNITRELADTRFKNLHFIQSITDFDDLKLKLEEMKKISVLFSKILENQYIDANQEELLNVLSAMKTDEISQEFLYQLFMLGTKLNKMEFLPIFAALLKLPQHTDIADVCVYIQQLAGNGFPVPYIEQFISIFNADEFNEATFLILREVFQANPHDPVLNRLFAPNSSYTLSQILQIVPCLPGQDVSIDREKLADFIDTTGCIDFFLENNPDDSDRVKKSLMILTKIFAQKASEGLETKDYQDLIQRLNALNPNELNALQQLYTQSNVSFICLRDGLATKEAKNLNFDALLIEFEKNPFGARSKSLHDKSQVERVINQLYDRLNDSVYPYHYRKQIMEAFLFVDACGHNLKVFSGKSAEELTNQELQGAFQNLKENEDKTFEAWLLGLALIREAMYRTSGKYAYSTQIIALIESMLHDGDALTNIETGQGKSITDAMHASLLWLGSDHVTVTAPSHVDSGRDLVEFSGCFNLLGIKHAHKPLTSTSGLDEFSTDGINYIAFSHLGLLVNRARVAGKQLLGNDADKASLIINESDDTILNDRVVCRLALTDIEAPSPSQFWIYDEINDFIDGLLNDPGNDQDVTVTMAEDIASLRQRLKECAVSRRVNQKQCDYIDNLDDDRLWMWMCSAKRVNDLNQAGKDDYIIPPEKEYKNIDGTMRLTHVVKLVMQDKQINLESQYGEGAMQLLYARLNRQADTTGQYFVIPRESKTVLSSTNRVLIKEYQKHQGVVRGSSATTGSHDEIVYQHKHYGFGATTIPPHQISKMVVHKPVFSKNDSENTHKIIQVLRKSPKKRPKLIICANIAEAQALYRQIQNDGRFPAENTQLFTGMPNEEQRVIDDAAKPGMITITTPALGRNKDVRYLRKIGMDVIHTSIQEDRVEIQGNGRTAREGSPGDVYFCLDTSKYDKTKEAIKAELAETNERAREKSQWIHDLLNYLLVTCDPAPGADDVAEDFFHKDWSVFSKDWEAHYRESIRDKSPEEMPDVQNKFITDICHAYNSDPRFNNINIDINTLQTFMDAKHKKREEYLTYKQDVKMADCMQPETLKLRLQNQEEGGLVGDVNDSKLLRNAFEASRKSFWFQTPLTYLMQDKNALRMFREIANRSGQEDALSDAKEGAALLMKEYLTANYFMSQTRKDKANSLIKEQIPAVTSTQGLYDLITKTQVELAEGDIDANKTRWRSIHFFGRSRFQESLSAAVVLVRTLDKNIKIPQHASESESESDTDTPEHISKFKYSAYKGLMFSDKSNAKVIHRSIQEEDVFEQEDDRDKKPFRPRD